MVVESAAGTHAGEVSGRIAGSSPAPPRHPPLCLACNYWVATNGALCSSCAEED